jgi:hypothetical protein
MYSKGKGWALINSISEFNFIDGLDGDCSLCPEWLTVLFAVWNFHPQWDLYYLGNSFQASVNCNHTFQLQQFAPRANHTSPSWHNLHFIQSSRAIFPFV